MSTYFIGCLHLGHEALAKWGGFQDSFYHDNHLIDQWNRVVTKTLHKYLCVDAHLLKYRPISLEQIREKFLN